MKPLAYTRFKYSGEYYKFVREDIGDTTNVNYYFVKNIPIIAGIDTNAKLIIRCEEPLLLGSLVANIKDANGNLILDDAIWQISSIQPVLNAFNNIEHYTMKTVKFQGTI